MKTSNFILALFPLFIAAASAANIHHARHIHRDLTPNLNTLSRRCARRPTVPNVATGSGAASTPSSSAAASTTTAPAPPANAPPPGGAGAYGLTGNCGNSGATGQITATSGPNGAIGWLNCGIDGAGWNPPYLSVANLHAVELGWAVTQPGSPFGNCAPFIWLFQTYGNQFGIPPILLASFAMQESSCRQDAVGGGGEQGLMQLTVEKCGGAPNGYCRDPDFNIRTGARYFRQTLDECGGNVVLAIGRYNGWHPGLTYGEATAARWSGCCRCQNNLDYLHQFLNGWCQNVDASGLGIYFNLAVCG